MPTWKSVCEVIIKTPPTDTAKHTPADWASVVEELIYDGMGFALDTEVIVKTITLEKEE